VEVNSQSQSTDTFTLCGNLSLGKERKKNQKRKKLRKGRFMETAAAVEIEQAFGDIFLDDFPRCLENPAGFSTVTTNPTAVN
jgi:hypothetical protein